MECGTASRGALLAAAPLAGRRPRLLPLPPPSSTPSIQIQDGLYSMSLLPLKARGMRRCEASLASDYTRQTSEYADLDWENLGFGLVQTDYMYITKCGPDGSFDKGEIVPFGPIALNPSSGVLNYGQGLFEGLKAYKKTDGSILLFRPEENAARMRTGAERMCMPAPTVEQFVDGVKQTVLANKRWVPPTGKGSLYIRPLLVGSGPVLGLAPAPEYTFIIFVSPVGNYFKEGLAPINLIVEDNFHRATPGGTGGVKTIGNYASALSKYTHHHTKGVVDRSLLTRCMSQGSDGITKQPKSEKNLHLVIGCMFILSKLAKRKEIHSLLPKRVRMPNKAAAIFGAIFILGKALYGVLKDTKQFCEMIQYVRKLCKRNDNGVADSKRGF